VKKLLKEALGDFKKDMGSIIKWPVEQWKLLKEEWEKFKNKHTGLLLIIGFLLVILTICGAIKTYPYY